MPSITPSAPSLAIRIVKFLLRLKPKKSGDPRRLRRQYMARDYPQAPAPDHRLTRQCTVNATQAQGWPVIELAPKAGTPRHHIIYLHGGSYIDQMNVHQWHIIGKLIEATGAGVSVPLYPLAPEHDCAPAFDLVLAVYRRALTQYSASQIILCGDSAGAGLALGAAVALQDAGLPEPGRVILFSPWLDITLSDPSARAIEQRDVMLNIDMLQEVGKWWAGDRDPRHPTLSPLYADMSGMPPIDIYQGVDDILLADARSFARRAQREGAAVALHEFPGAFHDFMAATFLPEAKCVYRQIAKDLAI